MFFSFPIPYSYKMKVFIVSRRAFQISFSIHTDFKSICYVQNFLPYLTLDEIVSGDGQLLFSFFFYLLYIAKRITNGSVPV